MPSFIEISPPVANKKILKGFYHIWAWRPSWSCDLDYTHWFPFPIDASYIFGFYYESRFNEKRDNKQCLLNTPRRVTVYHKTNFGNKVSSCKCPVGVHHVGMISNCSIKNCGQVGVDRPVKAFTCKKKTKKNCLSSHSCHFIKKKIFFHNKNSSC